MLKGFLGSWSLQRVNLEEPSDKVEEVLVFALEALLEGSLLGDQDVDLELFIVTGRRLGLLLAALAFLIVAGLLVNEPFTGEEV